MDNNEAMAKYFQEMQMRMLRASVNYKLLTPDWTDEQRSEHHMKFSMALDEMDSSDVANMVARAANE